MIISEGINHGKLQSIIVGELKKAGLKHRLKKIILKNLKDNKTVFGAPLSKVPSCSVICCGSTLSIPMIVTEMSTVLRRNAHIEGLFRKAGSQSRQKDIKRLLDAGGCVSEGHHPIDVASVLKLFLRHLPEPLISAEVQDLLLRCRLTAGDDSLKSILHTLLLLPVLHVHLLHYIMELLSFIASRHRDNLMDSSNLAIVLAPSIMPLPAAASAQRLEHHVALVKIFIENAKHIGVLTEELMSQLDDDSEIQIARQKKRRSGSINRVFNGLRKMVSNTMHTPASVRERDNRKTPVIKSAAKRKLEGYDGLSAKRKNEIIQNLPNKELLFTPMKLGLNERKKLRLSMMETRSTPKEENSHKNSETSVSSEDVRTSSEHLFTDHDTIDLSSDMKNPDKDYVRIPKQEYEEIKSRVSAIETRLSREFTDITATRPGVEPLQEVQNVYEQTLEDVAMLDCPTSDNLARRLSRELKIRPNEHGKIIRSPSARKIGNIRRRSKENVPKIVRHKSWNVSTLSNQNVDRFYPYISLRRERTSTSGSGDFVPQTRDAFDLSAFNQHVNSVSQKYQLRKRSTATPEHIANKTIGKAQKRRSLNSTINSSSNMTDNSLNNTNSSEKSDVLPEHYENFVANRVPKWKNAAAFFIDKTGEIDNCNQTGRPSVNKLRSQNAGAVMAKARLFETSSDKSSDWSANDKLERNGFARKPRTAVNTKLNRQAVIIKGDVMSNASRNRNIPPVPPRSKYITTHYDHSVRKKTPPVKMVSPKMRTPQSLSMKKPLVTPRVVRTPVASEPKKGNTPMKGIHNLSPRRRSPRQNPKLQRV